MAMAEIEMDVDMAPTFNFDGHMDEDLIDYDIDTTEEQKQTSWPTHVDEKVPDHTAVDTQTDVSMGIDSKMSEAVNDPGEPQEAGGDDLHNEDADDDGAASAVNISSKQSPPQLEEPYHDDVDVFQADEAEESTNVNAGETDTAIESRDVKDEIDYEDDEDTLAQGSYDEPEREDDDVDEAGSNYNQDLAENASNTTPTNPASPTAQTPQSVNDVESAAEAEDEITWEQGDGEDENATTYDGTESHVGTENVEDEPITGFGNEYPEEQSDAEATQNAETPGHSNDVDFDHDDTVVAGLEDGDSTTGQQEELISHPDHSVADDQEFPAITVQYRGDEFPFFSQAASEGFFSDSSVLDNSMESLLAGFRAELANEIAAEDELVFQVDELGLEFAESSLRDSLSTTTLRQILEIFDLLVKNQDPESSRTLYTYLFTRPSTSKRFEFLIESAAAGKGLDEVIHLFESPMPQNTIIVEASRATDDADESPDSHDSVADENVDDEDTVSQEAEQQEDHDEDADDGDDKQTLTDDMEYHDHNEAPMDGVNEHGEEHNDGEEEEEEENQPVDADEVNEEDQQLVEDPIVDFVVEPDHQTTAEEPDHSPDATDTNEHVESDSNPFIHLELDEPEEGNDDEAERGDIPVTPEPFDDENAITSAANTNTTNTLTLDNGETMPHLAEINTGDLIEQELTEDALVDQDELAEIDWRRDPDFENLTGLDEPVTPSGLSKRPRPDDELSMEEGQDAKRRRP